MDDDCEDGAKSVDENPFSGEGEKSQPIIGGSADGKDEGRSGLSDDTTKNIKQVGTVFNDESESQQDVEEFEDALEDCNDATETRRNSDKKCDEIGDEEGDDETVEEPLTPEEKEEKKIQALEYKDKGNEYFKRSEYPEAREYYTMAVKICPKCFAKEKSIFYANRAACLIKMDHNKEAIEDCTKALDLNPDYHKARLRRAQCYEHEDRLEEALEDYQKVFDADRSSHVAREALMRLPEQIKIKHEKMKEEMIGKLKELGNVVLRPFGLSTDNFKLQQDPNTGGYSINFQNSK